MLHPMMIIGKGKKVEAKVQKILSIAQSMESSGRVRPLRSFHQFLYALSPANNRFYYDISDKLEPSCESSHGPNPLSAFNHKEDDRNKKYSTGIVKDKVIFPGAEANNIVDTLDYIQSLYSEIIMLYLSLVTLLQNNNSTNIAIGTFQLILFLQTAIFNAVTPPASFCFHDLLKPQEVHNIDCLPNAAIYCIPMILNGASVLFLSEELSNFNQDQTPISTIVVLSISCGYMLFASSVVTIDLYAQIFKNVFLKANAKPQILFKALSILVGSLLPFGITAGIIYLGLYPGNLYLVTLIGILVVQIVLGTKGHLVLAGIMNIASLSLIFVMVRHFIGFMKLCFQTIKSLNIMELFRTMKARLKDVINFIILYKLALLLGISYIGGFILIWVIFVFFGQGYSVA